MDAFIFFPQVLKQYESKSYYAVQSTSAEPIMSNGYGKHKDRKTTITVNTSMAQSELGTHRIEKASKF